MPVRPGSSVFRLPLSQETRPSPTPGAPIPMVLGSLLHLCSIACVPLPSPQALSGSAGEGTLDQLISGWSPHPHP